MTMPGCIAPRAPGLAAHALAAVPDCLTLQEFKNSAVIPGLHKVDDPSGVIVVILCRRTYACAYAAVHAGIETLLKPYVLH